MQKDAVFKPQTYQLAHCAFYVRIPSLASVHLRLLYILKTMVILLGTTKCSVLCQSRPPLCSLRMHLLFSKRAFAAPVRL